MNIDATDLILGRLAAVAAKQALLGETINIVNCERAVISGRRLTVLAHYQKKVRQSSIRRGPFFPRIPDRLVRRTVRGMLDYKSPRGKAAFSRVMCYRGVPDALTNQKLETLPQASAKARGLVHYVTVHEISKLLGGVK